MLIIPYIDGETVDIQQSYTNHQWKILGYRINTGSTPYDGYNFSSIAFIFLLERKSELVLSILFNFNYFQNLNFKFFLKLLLYVLCISSTAFGLPPNTFAHASSGTSGSNDPINQSLYWYQCHPSLRGCSCMLPQISIQLRFQLRFHCFRYPKVPIRLVCCKST